MDATRVGNVCDVPASLSQNKTPNGIFNEYGGGADKELDPNQGRWPPNLLLSHHPDCKPTGEVRRVGNGEVKKSGKRAPRELPVYGGGPPTTTRHAPDNYGTEPQEVWICHESCPIRLLDEQGQKIGAHAARNKTLEVNHTTANKVYAGEWMPQATNPDYYGSDGGSNVSRFFPRFEPEAPFHYVAKASRAERNKGLEGMPETDAILTMGVGVDTVRRCPKHDTSCPSGSNSYRCGCPVVRTAVNRERKTTTTNPHPTVKPIALMRWLVRLVCPPNGTVLDPFAGSGSTGCAAVLEGFDFIGIEQDAKYAEIARRRIAYWSTPEYLRPKTSNAEVAEALDPTDPTFTGRLF